MKNRRALIIGVIASAAMLAILFFMQSRHGPALDLPIRYLFASFTPAIIGLVAGGYVTRVKTPIGSVEAAIEKLPEAPQKTAIIAGPSETQWQHKRADEYARTCGIELAHVYRPSTKPGQLFDIFIFLVRHKKGSAKPPKNGLSEIQQVEFYFGEAWGHEVFTVANTGGPIGVRTHAFGTFLATARITFTDPKNYRVVLHRYIDFEMARSA